jgi:uncharacterized membrane protein
MEEVTPPLPISDEPTPITEDVWSYRGYHLKAGEFNTAMVHLYRAEVNRANVWRQRLDTTTNWAVLATGAALSFAFGDLQSHHSVVIITTLLVSLFLYIEARRYRYYEMWSSRVRLLETDFFAAMLVHPFRPSPEWGKRLSDSLLYPQFTISIWEALGRRLRRNYLWLYFLLGIMWILKIWLLPNTAQSWDEVFVRAQIGDLPGWLITAGGLLFYGTLATAGIATYGLRQAKGEVLRRPRNELVK